MQRAQGPASAENYGSWLRVALAEISWSVGLGRPGHMATAEAGWEALSMKEGLAA